MAGINYLAVKLGGQPELSAEAGTQESTEIQTQAAETSGTVVQASTGNDVSAIVEKAMPSVVAINNKTLYTTQDWFFGTQQFQAQVPELSWARATQSFSSPPTAM